VRKQGTNILPFPPVRISSHRAQRLRERGDDSLKLRSSDLSVCSEAAEIDSADPNVHGRCMLLHFLTFDLLHLVVWGQHRCTSSVSIEGEALTVFFTSATRGCDQFSSATKRRRAVQTLVASTPIATEIVLGLLLWLLILLMRLNFQW
jgi:hypothetical protein